MINQHTSAPQSDAAHAHALARLLAELPPTLTYHSVAHTRDDVVPAVERLAATSGVTGEALLLLQTAAWYHDIGYVVQAPNHEAISVQIAETTLPDFGYTAPQVAAISGMIMATRLPQSPHTMLEQLLTDADLDVLGHEEFVLINARLRTELAALGTTFSDGQWYDGQLRFLREHRYFSAAARQLRDAGKQRNIARLAARLAPNHNP